MVSMGPRYKTVKISEVYADEVDKLVASGRYSSRADVVRDALRSLLEQDEKVKIESLYLDKKIYDHVKELSIQAHLTINETIERLLHENYHNSEQKNSKKVNKNA